MKNKRKNKFGKELLLNLYIKDELSIKEISKQLNCSYSYIRYLLKKYEIPIRNKSIATKLWLKKTNYSTKGIKRPEFAKKISGKNHHFFGKKRPDMSIKFSGSGNPQFGKEVSTQTKEKLSIAGKGRKHSAETKKILSLANKNKPKSEETKRILSKNAKERFKIKENHPRWEGGKTVLNVSIRSSEKYIFWRTQCFVRGHSKCQICNAVSNLHVDHIKPFALILKENSIKTIEEAYVCSELWDINNGRVLCFECHKKTDTYGYKTRLLTIKFDNATNKSISVL